MWGWLNWDSTVVAADEDERRGVGAEGSIGSTEPPPLLVPPRSRCMQNERLDDEWPLRVGRVMYLAGGGSSFRIGRPYR